MNTVDYMTALARLRPARTEEQLEGSGGSIRHIELASDGEFVLDRYSSLIGIARSTDDGEFVEFVEVLGRPPRTEPRGSKHLPCELAPGTQVWVKPEEDGGFHRWGIVAASNGSKNCIVEFPDAAVVEHVPAGRIVLRVGDASADPASALAEGFIDSMQAYKARVVPIRNLVHQRALALGLSAATSACIELHAHQLAAAAQIATDPICRYVLADEVGLGKTIEAGLVIRQRLLDDATASVMVAVPSELMGQWKQELLGRLLLGGPLVHRWSIVEHDDLGQAVFRQPSILVIDEAHRLARRALEDPTEASILESVAEAVSGLLLLTATPARQSADQLHYLLHLIDPAGYPRDGLDDFRRAFDERTEVAAMLALLADPDEDWEDTVDYLEELRERHAGDSRLDQLFAHALDVGEDDRSAVSAVVRHITEFHRLSRRVIRNQRAANPDYPVVGRKFVVEEFVDAEARVMREALDEWRDITATAQMDSAVPPSVDAGLSGRTALVAFFEEAGSSAEDPAAAAFAKNAVARLEAHPTDARVEAAVAYGRRVWSAAGQSRKLLIFSSSTATAAAIARGLEAVVGEKSVFGHLADMTDQEQNGAVAAVAGRAETTILVADSSAEEGRNLQFVDEVLHVELPLSVNRLEQRVGRVDRFGRSRIKHVRLADAGSPWDASVARLHQLTGVFDGSVSTLQRPLAELEVVVAAAIVDRGADFIAEIDESTWAAAFDREHSLIRKLNELDGAGIDEDLDPSRFEPLIEYDDSEWGSIKIETRMLLGKDRGLGLSEMPIDRNSPGVFRFKDPKGDHAQRLGPAACNRLKPVIQGPFAYNRAIAVRRPGTSPVRIGTPLVEVLTDLVRSDDQGRTRAVRRHVPGLAEPQLWFQFDVLVEASIGDLPESARLHRLADQLLSPAVLVRWSSPDGPPAPEFMNTHLKSQPTDVPDEPFCRESWAEFRPTERDFARLVMSAQDRMVDELRKSEAGRDRAERAERLLQGRIERLRSQSEVRGDSQIAKQLEEFTEVITPAVLQPKAQVLAVGLHVLEDRGA